MTHVAAGVMYCLCVRNVLPVSTVTVLPMPRCRTSLYLQEGPNATPDYVSAALVAGGAVCGDIVVVQCGDVVTMTYSVW